MAMGEAACAEPIKHLAPKLRHCLTNLIRTKFIFLHEPVKENRFEIYYGFLIITEASEKYNAFLKFLSIR